jgi:polyribonucleotide nucleotidyltransferase
MDIKVDGLSYETLAEALEQAKKGRLHILAKMLETISAPRPDYKPHVPRIEKIIIPKEMIGPLIGPGGKVIQEIQNTTGTTIVIEEINNVGVVDVFAVDKESIEAALKRIRAIVEVPEIGKIYKGKVKSIVSFGAFIEILPNKDGLLHISEIAWRRVNSAEEEMKVGDEIEVKLIDIDSKTGNLKLSRKVLLPRPEKIENIEKPEKPDRKDSR